MGDVLRSGVADCFGVDGRGVDGKEEKGEPSGDGREERSSFRFEINAILASWRTEFVTRLCPAKKRESTSSILDICLHRRSSLRISVSIRDALFYKFL